MKNAGKNVSQLSILHVISIALTATAATAALIANNSSLLIVLG